MAVVKTYKALREQNVAGHRRFYGDYLPEAADWASHVLSSYLRSEFLEVTYIDSDELDEALKVQRANDRVMEEASDADSLPLVDDEISEDDAEEPEELVDEAEEEDVPKPVLKLKKKEKSDA
jgi:hypothetical protein